jgi:hypothetical protein
VEALLGRASRDGGRGTSHCGQLDGIDASLGDRDAIGKRQGGSDPKRRGFVVGVFVERVRRLAKHNAVAIERSVQPRVEGSERLPDPGVVRQLFGRRHHPHGFEPLDDHLVVVHVRFLQLAQTCLDSREFGSTNVHDPMLLRCRIARHVGTSACGRVGARWCHVARGRTRRDVVTPSDA